jgi:hypothetical protein
MFNIFHPIFSKIIFLSIFLLFLFILGKNKTFKEKLFLEISKWRNGGIDDFFRKIQDFTVIQPPY